MVETWLCGLALEVEVEVARVVNLGEQYATHGRKANVNVEAVAGSATRMLEQEVLTVEPFRIFNQVATEINQYVLHGNVVSVTGEVCVDSAMDQLQLQLQLLVAFSHVQDALKGPAISSRLEHAIVETVAGLVMKWTQQQEEVEAIFIRNLVVVYASLGSVVNVSEVMHASTRTVKV